MNCIEISGIPFKIKLNSLGLHLLTYTTHYKIEVTGIPLHTKNFTGIPLNDIAFGGIPCNITWNSVDFLSMTLNWVEFSSKNSEFHYGISLNAIEFGGIIPFNNIEFSGFLFNNTELSWIKFRKLISWITLNSVQFHSIWNWIQCDSTS